MPSNLPGLGACGGDGEGGRHVLWLRWTGWIRLAATYIGVLG